MKFHKTVITDQSGRDHATDAETTKYKREIGLSESDSVPVIKSWLVRQAGEFHRAADNIGGSG